MAAAGSAGALALAGCGGGSKTTPEQGSGLLTIPPDTSSKAVRGGIWQDYATADPPTLDPNAGTGAPTWAEAGRVYSRLLRYKLGTRKEEADGAVLPDAAESYEQTPDGLQITLKLRPNMKFDSRPPTNGRPLNSDDVKFSYDRFKAAGGSRRDLFTELNSSAPLQSILTPDAQTVIMKLAFPYAPMLASLAFTRYVMLTPMEGDGKIDLRGDMRGAGPYMLTNYARSSRFEYRRNPDYYNKNLPFLDGIDRPIISEYANGLAQLKAGNIWTYNVRPEDILPMKRDIPDLNITQTLGFSRNSGPRIVLNQKTEPLYKDERVRQAISMLIDRQLYTDTFLGLKQYTDAGIDVPVRFSSHVPPGEPQWLDPMASEMGASAKYWKYDPATAAQLLGAAGLSKSSPVNAGWVMFTSAQYGPDWQNKNAAWQQMLADSGFFTFKTVIVEYAQFIEICSYARAEFPGGMCVSQTIAYPEVDGHLFAVYHTGGAFYRMPQPDPRFESLIEQQRKELDKQKRADIIKEFQRYAASKMYEVPIEAWPLGLSISWPVLANLGVFQNWDPNHPMESALMYWADKTKPPLGKS